MTSTAVLLLVLVGGAFSCPTDFQMQMGGCMGPLQGAMSGSAPNCSVINTATGCIRAIEQQCQGNAQVGAIIRSMQLSNLEGLCAWYTLSIHKMPPIPPLRVLMLQDQLQMAAQELCPKRAAGVGGCPPPMQLGQRVQSCMAGSFGPGADCAAMSQGVSCLENLQSQCANDPTFAQFFPPENLANMQATYRQLCPASNCAVDNPQKALRSCERRMYSRKTISKGPISRCRRVLEGLDCVINLLEQCPSVSNMSVASLQDQRQQLVEGCPQRGSNNSA